MKILTLNYDAYYKTLEVTFPGSDTSYFYKEVELPQYLKIKKDRYPLKLLGKLKKTNRCQKYKGVPLSVFLEENNLSKEELFNVYKEGI